MPRRLGVIALYLMSLALWSGLLFYLFDPKFDLENCANNRRCSEATITTLRNLLAVVVIAIWVTYAGLRGRLPGARRVGPRSIKTGGIWRRITTAVGASSAVAVFMPLLALPGLVLAPAAILGLKPLVDSVSPKAMLPLSMALSATAFIWLGVPAARILLRLLPPRPGRGPRLGSIALALAVAGVVLSNFRYPWMLDFPFRFVVHGIALATVLGIVVPVIARQLRPTGFAGQPFVLLLRRFSSFADRAVVQEILASRPSEGTIALLTPTTSQGGDWDPLQTAFAGLRWHSPLQSIPTYLRAGDEDWKSHVREYIQRASRIVLDGTDASESIQDEVALITEFDRWHDTLVLVPSTSRASWPSGATVVTYGRSWVRALPRIALGAVVTVVVALGVGNVTTQYKLFVVMPLLLLLFVTMYLYFFMTYWRPAVDRSAARAIRTWARLGDRPPVVPLGSPSGTLVLLGAWLYWLGSWLTLSAGQTTPAMLLFVAIFGAVLAQSRRRLRPIRRWATFATLVLATVAPGTLLHLDPAGHLNAFLSSHYVLMATRLLLPADIPFDSYVRMNAAMPPLAWLLAAVGSLLWFRAHFLDLRHQGVSGRGDTR